MSTVKMRYGAPGGSVPGKVQMAVPDFENRQTVISAEGGTYTIIEYGFVEAIGGNYGSTGDAKPRFSLSVNGMTVCLSTGRNDTYCYMTGPLVPVKPGDVVKLDLGTFAGFNDVYFFPLLKV